MGFIDFVRGGIPLLFMGGSREICELIDYESKTFLIQNKEVTRVRLFVIFSEKFKSKQTGFWYDPISDFDPPLPGKNSQGMVPWEDLGNTTLVCFKSFDGQHNWFDTKLQNMELRLRTLNDYINNLKRSSITLLRALESLKDPNVSKEDTFHLAEELAALDKLIRKTPEVPDLGEVPGQANVPWLRE